MNIRDKYVTYIDKPGVYDTLCGQPTIPRYERFQTVPILPERNHPIPPIIHFVWIGSSIPYKYVKNILTFVATNKSQYVFKLWVDHETPPIEGVVIKNIYNDFPGTFINRDIFDIETNWSAKADILKYEIVYNEGGINSDVDAISIRPYNDENKLFDRAFVCYAEHGYNDIGTCLFGFPAESNFLKYVIDCLREVRMYSYDFASLPTKIRVLILTGPQIFTQCFQFYNDPTIQMISQDIVVLDKNNPDAYSYHTFDSVLPSGWHNQK